MSDRYREALLESSAAFMEAQLLSFANAIIAAKSAQAGRMTDEEIADVAGVTAKTVRWVLGDR